MVYPPRSPHPQDSHTGSKCSAVKKQVLCDGRGVDMGSPFSTVDPPWGAVGAQHGPLTVNVALDGVRRCVGSGEPPRAAVPTGAETCSESRPKSLLDPLQ